jgi:hypothetical protein
MQTFSVITIPLRLYRIYLTKTSIVQTWWFIKIIEVKKNDIFAIDINKKEGKNSLHIFVADRLLGNIVMERIISDTEKGFYIEPTPEFVGAIRKHINGNLLTKDVINYPDVSETKDLRKDIGKLSNTTLKEKTSQIIYLSLMLFHPISVFLILEYFYHKFLLSLILSSLMIPVLDYVRQKLSSRLTANIKKIPEIDKIYGNQPIEVKMNSLNEYLDDMKDKKVR